MFGIFVQEREPLKLEDLPGMLNEWILTVGTFAAFGLAAWVLWFILRMILLPRPQTRSRSTGGDFALWFVGALVGGVVVGLLPAGAQVLWNRMGWVDPATAAAARAAWLQPLKDLAAKPRYDLLALYGASCALVAILLPLLANSLRMRGRRIWAIAMLSFKEALRRRVLWGFSLLLLVFLFGSWFLPFKAEDQVRNYVRAVFWAMTPLLLVTAGLLAAFSIPSDIKNLSIHTIVTKPVERFEVIAGRFLGFVMLMSLVLVVMSLLSLVYVARGVNPEAREDSLKARVPIYGALAVNNPKSVGYEWEYRQYLSGASDDEAVWTFYRLPPSLAERTEPVRCEFTFDIFRTTKGEENRGVNCTFVFKSSRWKAQDQSKYEQERDRIMNQPDEEVMARALQEHWSVDKRLAVQFDGLAEKYGYYEILSKEVVDFHVLHVDLPVGLFKSIRESPPGSAPPLQIAVRCESSTQYLGVAKHDLYLLDAERSFPVNFFKAGAVGLWFRICLITALAITCSTYLSGIIAFIAAMVVYILGLFPDFIKTVAEGKSIGGGPVENMLRLGTGAHTSYPLDATPAVTLARASDVWLEKLLGGLLGFFPDVDRFDFTDHVAEGFDVSGGQLLVTAIFLVGYMLPWVVLGYYLIKSREVAA